MNHGFASYDPVTSGQASPHCLKEIVNQQWNVGSAFAQWWNYDRHYLKAIEEILTKASSFDRSDQIGVAGGNHPRVDPGGTVGPDGTNNAVLEHSEQLGLKRQGHLADLVEKNSPIICGTEQTMTGTGGSGEGAALMPEHFGLEQLMGNRRTVDRNEGAISPPGKIVDSPRDNLFTTATLASDQHCRVRGGNALYQRPQFGDRRMLADQHLRRHYPRAEIG
jgi:hypothetical protein